MPDIKFPFKVKATATATNTPKAPDPKKED
jgi:hypothetical protein